MTEFGTRRSEFETNSSGETGWDWMWLRLQISVLGLIAWPWTFAILDRWILDDAEPGSTIGLVVALALSIKTTVRKPYASAVAFRRRYAKLCVATSIVCWAIFRVTALLTR